MLYKSLSILKLKRFQPGLDRDFTEVSDLKKV
jgi:hypothetical protein